MRRDTGIKVIEKNGKFYHIICAGKGTLEREVEISKQEYLAVIKSIEEKAKRQRFERLRKHNASLTFAEFCEWEKLEKEEMKNKPNKFNVK